mmetsp:Transcript_45961/g.127741  ORF Transcript_45961/g.127741 Transcript_45961/m.127741 type:complete len:191 (-) Transcript_45961:95-667(-)
MPPCASRAACMYLYLGGSRRLRKNVEVKRRALVAQLDRDHAGGGNLLRSLHLCGQPRGAPGRARRYDRATCSPVLAFQLRRDSLVQPQMTRCQSTNKMPSGRAANALRCLCQTSGVPPPPLFGGFAAVRCSISVDEWMDQITAEHEHVRRLSCLLAPMRGRCDGAVTRRPLSSRLMQKRASTEAAGSRER